MFAAVLGDERVNFAVVEVRASYAVMTCVL